MSLSVEHLNGDTTFLLTFAPSAPWSGLDSAQRSAGTFTILVDPWLSGPSTMWHPKFLLSRHTIQSSIPHLSHIPEPNIVLVSQEKPDHCHEATLRQLDPTSPITTILAEPAAARRIRNMKHFNPAMVHSLRPYSTKNSDSVIRFYIPPIVHGGAAGEATISFVPGKMDLAGVHNAIGVTYRPPSTASLPGRPQSPSSPNYQAVSNPATQPISTRLPMTPPDSPPSNSSTAHGHTSRPSDTSTSTPLSQPSSSFSSTHPLSPNSSISSFSTTNQRVLPHAEKTLSFIYSPHGVSYSLIRDFASSHLIAAAALPLTLLLHGFDRVSNPWWMGGNVATGLPGGVEIAQNLMARCWISAHDEEKENSGLSTLQVKTRKYTTEEVETMCRESKGLGATRVLNLGVGQEICLKG